MITVGEAKKAGVAIMAGESVEVAAAKARVTVGDVLFAISVLSEKAPPYVKTPEGALFIPGSPNCFLRRICNDWTGKMPKFEIVWCREEGVEIPIAFGDRDTAMKLYGRWLDEGGAVNYWKDVLKGLSLGLRRLVAEERPDHEPLTRLIAKQRKVKADHAEEEERFPDNEEWTEASAEEPDM